MVIVIFSIPLLSFIVTDRMALVNKKYVGSRAVIPNAGIAVKLAEALDTSVEYLVKGSDPQTKPDLPQKEIRNYEKYKRIIDDLDTIPQEYLPALEAMIHAAAKKLPRDGQTV